MSQRGWLFSAAFKDSLHQSLVTKRDLTNSIRSHIQHLILTNNENEEGDGSHEEKVLGGACEPLSHVGFAGGAVTKAGSCAILPNLLIDVRGQLHLHLAVVTFHVLGQVETRIGVWLPIKLQ